MDKLRSLYSGWEVPTEEGNDFYREVYNLLDPVFQRAVAKNIRIRDLAHTIQSAVGELEAYHNLKRNSAAYNRGEKPNDKT